MKNITVLLFLLNVSVGCSKEQNVTYYSYAPSIIYTENTWHEYFCSKGTEGIGDWDDIRHSTSSDLINWTLPQELLVPVAYERSNCDPSIVRYDAGDGPYYYMFYGGNIFNVQTVVFVSRSFTPDGIFLKYTQRGTWEQEPQDPKAIVLPFTANDEGVYVYGAGQPTVIVHNGKLLMWYLDDTANMPNNYDIIYFISSSDGIHWTSPVATTVSNSSVEVKYDAVNNVFVMFEIQNQYTWLVGSGEMQDPAPYLTTRTSSDGVNWGDITTICDVGCFPNDGNNIGVSSDDTGALIPGALAVRFAVPAAVYVWVLSTIYPELLR